MSYESSRTKLLWGKEVHDVSLPPMQPQVSVTHPTSTAYNDWNSRNHFTYFFSKPNHTIDKVDSDHYSTGDETPFLGYTTPSGSLEPNIHFIEKDILVAKVKKLVDLASWLNKSKTEPTGKIIVSNARPLIDKLLKIYGDLSLAQLAPFQAPKKGGTQNHHLKARDFKASIVPNCISNLYTRVKGESNTHFQFKLSPDHHLVNFLHIYCFSIWISFGELEISPYTNVPPMLWGVITSCLSCNQGIKDEPLVFNPKLIVQCEHVDLNITKIGEISEEIIKASVAEFQNKGYVNRQGLNPDRQLSYKFACRGILQEFIDVTYTEKVRL